MVAASIRLRILLLDQRWLKQEGIIGHSLGVWTPKFNGTQLLPPTTATGTEGLKPNCQKAICVTCTRIRSGRQNVPLKTVSFIALLLGSYKYKCLCVFPSLFGPEGSRPLSFFFFFFFKKKSSAVSTRRIRRSEIKLPLNLENGGKNVSVFSVK
jgi:hypothetical protein